MRSRYIKPGFFLNEELADLPPLTRLLFAGLWLLADREGRVADRPRRIKAELFPYEDDCDVDSMLDALASAGFVNRYEVDDVCALEIVGFKRHQNPHKNEPESLLPERSESDGESTSTNWGTKKRPSKSFEPIELEDVSEVAAQEVNPERSSNDSSHSSNVSLNETKRNEMKRKEKKERHSSTKALVDAVFSHWLERMDKHPTRTKLDKKRQSRIEWALEQYGKEACCLAIDGCALSDWHMGRDSRNGGKSFNDLTLIFRDAEHVERFLDFSTKPASVLDAIEEAYGTEDEA